MEFSEQLPLMENTVDRTHLRPQPTNSSSSSSEENEEENVNEKEQLGSSLVSTMLSSELLQDGSCLAEQHLSTVEGNWFTNAHTWPLAKRQCWGRYFVVIRQATRY